MYYSSRKKKQPLKWQGIVLSCISLIIMVISSFTLNAGFGKALIGVFGVLLYPLLLFLILVGVAITANLKFSLSKKNVVYLTFSILLLSLILHTAFLGGYFKQYGTNIKNYFAFLANTITFKTNTTVGGVILSLIAYPFISLLGVVGSCIVFSIAFVIFAGLTIDYYVNLKRYYDSTIKRQRATRMATNPDAYITSQDSIAGSMQTLNRTSDAVPLKNYEEDYLGYLKPNEKIINPYSTEDLNSTISTTTGEATDQYGNATDVVDNATINALYGKQSAQGFEDGQFDDALYNDEKATSSYDPQKFASTTDYITYPYVPKMFDKYNNQNQQDDSYYNQQTYNEVPENQNELVNIEQQDDPFTFNTSANSLYNNQDEDDYTETQKYKVDNTTEYGNTTNQIEQEQFESPACDFFNQSPKIVPEQLSLVDRKPTKSYKQEKDTKYNAPPTTLLTRRSDDDKKKEDYNGKIEKLENVLKSFKIEAKVKHVTKGPTVTQYELEMPYGISVKKVLAYDSDITSALQSKCPVRIEAPILGKNTVGIEVGNDVRGTVGMREALESKEFQSTSATLPVIIGKNVSGEVMIQSLPKMVHMLVAGSTGSGKSIFLHSLILSLMYKCSPSQVRFILIDPKRVEFTGYSGMPHMMLPNAVSECDKAINALGWAVKEMDRRFKKLQKYRVQNINDFNHCSAVTETHEEEPMSYLVIVIDELADLMMLGKKEVEEKIMRIAQLGRASGIHMIIATQRPSTDVITGTIKTNLPTRVAFMLSSSIDSRTILDETGAEKLLGKGDMLISVNGAPQTRMQGAFMEMSEVRDVVDYIKEHNESYFDEEVAKEILSTKTSPEQENNNINSNSSQYDPDNPEEDELLPRALKLCIEKNGASINLVQRRFKVGYARAARIIDQMELAGYISQGNGSKLRSVFMTMSEFKEKFGEDI